MRFRILLIGLLCLASTSATGSAQDAPPVPPPKDPLLPRAPEVSAWSVEEKSANQSNEPDEGGKPDEQEIPGKRTITKSGNVYREITEDPERGPLVKWVIDGLQIRKLPSSGRLSRIPSTQFSSHYSDYRRSDFEPFEWISRENYRGVEEYEGVLCYVFEVSADKKRLTPREVRDRELEHSNDGTTEQVALGTPIESENRSSIAYLDVATQLPVALHDGQRIIVYTFLPTPEAALQPPQEVLENISQWKTTIESKTPRRPKS